MSKSFEVNVKRAPLLALFVLAGCAKVVHGQASPEATHTDSVADVRTPEITASPTTKPPVSSSSKPPKVCKWSESLPQPFQTTNPQVGTTLTPECTLKPTDPIKIYQQPDQNSSEVATLSPKGELAVGVYCVTEGPEVEGVNGPSSSWVKAEAVVDKRVEIGYFAGPAVGYAALNAPKVDHC